METVPLGKSSLNPTRLAYGCWRIAGGGEPGENAAGREDKGRKAVLAAFEAGFRFFDHADIYCAGEAERIFGLVLKENPSFRKEILIASKCGIRKPGEPPAEVPYRYDSSAGHIVWSCEQSLKRLGTDVIDLYQIHRPDYLMNPEEVAAAFSRLKQSGKVREFGVSNFKPWQLASLQKACPMPLIAHQVEINVSRLDCFEDGTLDQCIAEGMTPLAWSPLAGGRLASNEPIDLRLPEHARRIAVRETLDLVARARNTSRSVAAVSWLLKHPSRIIPIIGSTDPEKIRDVVRAADLELSREEWYRILEASVGHRLP